MSALSLLTLYVMWVTLNHLGWFAVSAEHRHLSFPWNWRLFAGAWTYWAWLERDRIEIPPTEIPYDRLEELEENREER